MRVNLPRVWRLVAPAIVLAAMCPHSARAQASGDRQQEVEMAFDQYAEAKTDDQRAAVLDYLKHLDPKMVADALVDHIIASRSGVEATAYNKLLDSLAPQGCAAVLDRLKKANDPVTKGKLIVALRHCPGPEAAQALAACLDDKRPVAFEAHGPNPRRVCDLAYDELYLKLHRESQYGLDPGTHLKGIITEKTPVKDRDSLIEKLKKRIAKSPVTPMPSPAPVMPKKAMTSGT